MSEMTTSEDENWRLGIDFFYHESRWFERDVETIVLGSLNAGIKSVKRQLDRASTRFDELIEAAAVDEEDSLIDDFIDIRSDHEDQERFLRNMAVVALLSRLTHKLRKLARAAEDFAPRDSAKHAYAGENEFTKLWDEYRKRFGVAVSSKHIQWIEELRQARNLIVHNGEEANPERPDHEITDRTPLQEYRDTRFSRKYPQYVEGEGFTAQIRVTEIQLGEAATKAVELVKWLAAELREKQLQAAHIKAGAS